MASKLYIIVDDGHGASTPGKRSPIFEKDTMIGHREYCRGTSFLENHFNSPMSKILVNNLCNAGYQAVELCPTDNDISLDVRGKRAIEIGKKAKIKNQIPILFSIHANAHVTDANGDGEIEFNSANGIDTFYFTKGNLFSQKGKEIAAIIQSSLIKHTGAINRGIKGANFMILRDLYPSNVYPILIECGFMTNFEELKKLGTLEYKEKISKAILEALPEIEKLFNA